MGDSDIIGKTFSELTVLSMSTELDSRGRHKWNCKCSCGALKAIDKSNLVAGNTKSCGCRKTNRSVERLAKYLGNTFGRLHVLREGTVKDANGSMRFLCRCECGNEKEVSSFNLDNGTVKSCGCLLDEVQHGMAGSSEYIAWANMKSRCDDANDSHFNTYGGRGISYEPSWVDFKEFFKYIGTRPSELHSLDRINNDLGYHPGNVRWATRVEQDRNTTRTHYATIDGDRRPVIEWCEIFNLNEHTIRARIRSGLTAEVAIMKSTT